MVNSSVQLQVFNRYKSHASLIICDNNHLMSAKFTTKLLPVKICNSLWLGVSHFKSMQSKNVERMQANYMYALICI